MSTVPIVKTVSHKDDSFTVVGTQGPFYYYSRDCLEVHLEYNGRAIVLLGVHFNAKINDDPDHRLAEAQRTRAIAEAIVADAPDTAVIILGDFNDEPGSLPYDWTVGYNPPTYTNACDYVTAADRWTYLYYTTKQLVDQQMSNPTMAALLDTDSVAIWHTDDVDDASDHAPVIATYDVY